MSDAKTLQGVVDLVSRLIHEVNRLTVRVESLESTASLSGLTISPAPMAIGPLPGPGSPPGSGGIERTNSVPPQDTLPMLEIILDLSRLGLIAWDEAPPGRHAVRIEGRSPVASSATAAGALRHLHAILRSHGEIPADPEPRASAFLRRPDVAATLREAEQAPSPPATVPAPGFDVPRLREPVTVRPSAANAVGSVPRGMGGGIAFDGAHACTDDEESNP